MLDTINRKSLPALNFTHSKVLVVGDIMLDRYWKGTTDRISPEAPVPVVQVNDQSMRIGGAGNVAVNVGSLGAQAHLLSVVGQDDDGDDLMVLLDQYSIFNHCIRDPQISTTTKLRVLSQHQQLIRLDFEQALFQIDTDNLFEQYNQLLGKTDLVVLSDYGKGLFSDPRIFIQAAARRNIKVLVDPKYKDFVMYKGAFLVTPNKKEFEAFVGICATQSELEEKAVTVIQQCELGGILITQGDKGMTLVMKDQMPVHFPTHAQDVFDVTGAGDTVIAALAAGLSSGLSVKDAVHLSSIAAGIVVGRVGTAFVTQDDLKQAQQTVDESFSDKKIMSQTDMLTFVKQARLQHKKLVMTNGCFDLLHSGHVNYLEQAAQLGDVLIVAVNSDSSVKTLKGENRPINKLPERMSVLAGLSSVSKVIAFDEQTPQDLICLIKPDILVKGGDYQVEQIAGRECAGEVRLISLVEGRSTSSTVDKIKNRL